MVLTGVSILLIKREPITRKTKRWMWKGMWTLARVSALKFPGNRL